MIDLEILSNRIDSGLARKQNLNLEEQLEDISQRIEQSNIKLTPAILEKQAAAYAQLNLLEKAIKKYEKLFEQEKAIYSVKSMESYCNIKMKHLLESKTNRSTSGEVKKVIKKLKSLQNFGATAERHSLLGSAYKRQTMLLKPKKTKRGKGRKIVFPNDKSFKVLAEMTSAYKAAALLKFSEKLTKGEKLQLALKDSLGIKVYWIENWLIGERLLLESLVDEVARAEKKTAIAALLFPKYSIVQYLQAKMDKLEQGNTDEKGFWDFIASVNIGQCYLLYCEANEYESTLAKIKAAYNLAWKRGGTINNLESEITQMEFIIDHLYGKENNKLKDCLQKLRTFFEEKL